MCKHTKTENEADKLIKNLCLLYDLNYPYSHYFFLNHNIIKTKTRLLENHLPNNITAEAIEKELTEYLKRMTSKTK